MLAELLRLASLLLAVLLVLAAHQVGHVLGGKAGGLRFGLLVVGPLHVQRGTDGQLYWRLNKRLGLAGEIAACVAEGGTGLRRAYLYMVAGGPLTSVGLGVLALALYVVTGLSVAGPATEGIVADAAGLGLFTVAAGSISIGFGTLIPIVLGGFVNDGARILQLRRPGPKADRHAAVMALGSYYIAGQRPRDPHWSVAPCRSPMGPTTMRGAITWPTSTRSTAEIRTPRRPTSGRWWR